MVNRCENSYPATSDIRSSGGAAGRMRHIEHARWPTYAGGARSWSAALADFWLAAGRDRSLFAFGIAMANVVFTSVEPSPAFEKMNFIEHEVRPGNPL